MEEARGRQGRVGGTVKATKLYVHIATLLFYLLSLWECFSFMISSLFFFLPGSCTHPPTHQQSSPFIPALHLLGKGSATTIKRCGHTVPHSFVILRIEQPHAGRCCRCHLAFLFYFICQACLPNERAPVEPETREQQESLNTRGSCTAAKEVIYIILP